MNFYVYIYLDPRKPGKYKYNNYIFDFEPFYIGKGSGKKQLYRHLRDVNNLTKNSLKCSKIKNIIALNLQPVILKILDNLSENDAFLIEKQLIESIGRIDIKTGPLTNLKDGGRGGQSNPSEETRLKISNASKGKSFEERYGQEKAILMKEKIKKSNSTRIISDDTKSKISLANKNFILSEQHKQKLLANNPKLIRGKR